MKSKTKYVAFAGLASCALVAVGASRPLHAASGCKSVTGTFTETITTTDCNSPIGLCATGSATVGNTTFTTSWEATDNAPSAGMPATEASDIDSYDGNQTFTDSSGDTLTASDIGVLAPSTVGSGANYLFTEFERNLAGTGKYANVSGVVFINGSLNSNNSVFTGTLSGTVCGL